MKIKHIDVVKKIVIVDYMHPERLVTFNDNGDFDVEPFSDLSEHEGQELLDAIINDDEINAAVPCED